MSGGLAIRSNLLCVTHTGAQGRVFLFDMEARTPVSHWSLPVRAGGYTDAGGVAMDERFHLYVADARNDRVCHFSPFGRHLGDLGLPAGPGGDARRDQPGFLDRPHAVACWGDGLLVACGERPRRCGLQHLGRDGSVRRPLRSEGDPTRRFGAPRGLWVDGAGLLVTDSLGGSVQRFRPDGRYLASIATAAGDEVSRPHAVARTASGEVLVADAGDAPGLRCFQIHGQRRPLPDDLHRCEAVLAFAVDAAAHLLVLDHAGERVLRFHPDLTFAAVLLDLSEYLDDI